MGEDFFHFDEMQDALIALTVLKQQLQNLLETQNNQFWGWIIISLHKSIQSFMVLSLQGTDNLRWRSETDRKQWLEAYEGDGEYPQERLMNFPKLYECIKSPEFMHIWTVSKFFKPSGNQDQSMSSLNNLRNEFIHFTPKVWSIEVLYLISIVDDCLNVLKFLTHETGNILWHPTEREVIAKAIYDEIAILFKKVKSLHSLES